MFYVEVRLSVLIKKTVKTQNEGEMNFFNVRFEMNEEVTFGYNLFPIYADHEDVIFIS